MNLKAIFNKDNAIEFGVIVGGIVIGLIVGRFVSQWLQNAGVPIAGGPPLPVPLPEKEA